MKKAEKIRSGSHKIEVTVHVQNRRRTENTCVLLIRFVFSSGSSSTELERYFLGGHLLWINSVL